MMRPFASLPITAEKGNLMFSTSQILITLIAMISMDNASIPDLCDTVSPRTGTPSRCEPHYAGAPLFDDLACCDTDSCRPLSGSDCDTDEKLVYCELGELHSTGELSCYFEVPNYCDISPCDAWIGIRPEPGYVCCNSLGGCWPAYHDECFMENIFWCDFGTSNNDGSMTCYD